MIIHRRFKRNPPSRSTRNCPIIFSIDSLEQLEERRRFITLTLTNTGTKHIEVNRNNIVEDVLALYIKDPGIVNMELVVTFRNERGFDGSGNCFQYFGMLLSNA